MWLLVIVCLLFGFTVSINQCTVDSVLLFCLLESLLTKAKGLTIL